MSKKDDGSVVLSIVMPAFEEEHIYENILETIACVYTFCTDFEIIVVDDGSKDSTYSEIEKAAADDERIIAIRNQKNGGKGDALKRGTRETSGKYVAFLDADLDLHPRQLKKFMEKLQNEDADVVIGSKMHRNSKIDYPLQRRIISYIYYIILRVLFRLNIHDTQTGIKLFKGDLLRPIMEKILVKRFAYDIEVLAICKNRCANIIEMPIELNFQRNSRWGRMTLKDLWYTGLDTLAVFYRLFILKYYEK